MRESERRVVMWRKAGFGTGLVGAGRGWVGLGAAERGCTAAGWSGSYGGVGRGCDATGVAHCGTIM